MHDPVLIYEPIFCSPSILLLSCFPTQSRIIGAVRGARSQLWGTIIPVCSLYAARKYDRKFGTPAIV